MKGTYLPSVMPRNTAIDAARLLLAFLVVCLHTRFPIDRLAPFVADIGKVAVPFFLIVSGYYIFVNDKTQTLGRLINSAKNTGAIILQAGVAYALLRGIKQHIYHVDMSSQVFKLVPFMLLNDINFTEHLWYLFAYLYALAFAYWFVLASSIRALTYTLPILISIHFIFTTWSRFVTIPDGKFWYEFNWLVVGLPFFVIGLAYRKHETSFATIQNRYLDILILGLLAGIFLEHLAFKEFAGRGPGVFFTAMAAFVLFVRCANNRVILSAAIDKTLASFGRAHALNIYLYHVLIREILQILNAPPALNNSISIFTLSVLLSICIERFKFWLWLTMRRTSH